MSTFEVGVNLQDVLLHLWSAWILIAFFSTLFGVIERGIKTLENREEWRSKYLSTLAQLHDEAKKREHK